MGLGNSYDMWEKPERRQKPMRSLKAAASACHDMSTQIVLAKIFHIVKLQVNGEEVYSFHK